MHSRPNLKFPEPENIAAEGVRDNLVTVREQFDQVDLTRSLLSGEQDQEELDDIEIVGPIFEAWIDRLKLENKRRDLPVASLAVGSLVAASFNALWNTKNNRGAAENVWLVALLGGILAGGCNHFCRRVYGQLPLVPEDMPHAALETALKSLESAARKVSRVRGIRSAWERRASRYNARLRQSSPNAPPIGQVVRSTARLGILLR